MLQMAIKCLKLCLFSFQHSFSISYPKNLRRGLRTYFADSFLTAIRLFLFVFENALDLIAKMFVSLKSFLGVHLLRFWGRKSRSRSCHLKWIERKSPIALAYIDFITICWRNNYVGRITVAELNFCCYFDLSCQSWHVSPLRAYVISKVGVESHHMSNADLHIPINCGCSDCRCRWPR